MASSKTRPRRRASSERPPAPFSGLFANDVGGISGHEDRRQIQPRRLISACSSSPVIPGMCKSVTTQAQLAFEARRQHFFCAVEGMRDHHCRTEQAVEAAEDVRIIVDNCNGGKSGHEPCYSREIMWRTIVRFRSEPSPPVLPSYSHIIPVDALIPDAELLGHADKIR